MRIPLHILLMLFATAAVAQEPVKFRGVYWGMTIEEALKLQIPGLKAEVKDEVQRDFSRRVVTFFKNGMACAKLFYYPADLSMRGLSLDPCFFNAERMPPRELNANILKSYPLKLTCKVDVLQHCSGTLPSGEFVQLVEGIGVYILPPREPEQAPKFD